jgi:hypothetical protein
MDHRDEDDGFAAVDSLFLILAEASIPAEGAFDDPALGKNFEKLYPVPLSDTKKRKKASDVSDAQKWRIRDLNP